MRGGGWLAFCTFLWVRWGGARAPGRFLVLREGARGLGVSCSESVFSGSGLSGECSVGASLVSCGLPGVDGRAFLVE